VRSSNHLNTIIAKEKKKDGFNVASQMDLM